VSSRLNGVKFQNTIILKVTAVKNEASAMQLRVDYYAVLTLNNSKTPEKQNV
jgi:hypothetical protein